MSRFSTAIRRPMPASTQAPTHGRGGSEGSRKPLLSLLFLAGLIVAAVFAFRNTHSEPPKSLDDKLNEINQRATQSRRNLENANSPELDKLINKGAENQRKAEELEKAMANKGHWDPSTQAERDQKRESRHIRTATRLYLKVAFFAVAGALLLFRMTRG